MAVAPQPRAPRVTVNETLRDRGIAHAIFLERLKAGEGKRIVELLDVEVIPDLIEKLEKRLKTIGQRGLDIDPNGTRRLQDLLAVMQETVDSWTSGLAKDLARRTGEIGVAEAGWQRDLFNQVLPVRWDVVLPETDMLTAAIVASPIDGVLLDDIVSRLGDFSKRGIERAVRLGIAEGESIPRIVARIRKVTDLTRNTAEAVARTAVGHASAIGRDTMFKANADLIKAVQWIATLDTRTCPTCGALDGKVFPLDAGPRPPRHISCRCIPSPVLKSMKELGLNISDYTPATRASMNGQVPSSETFGTWLKKQAPSIQDEALGPTRGRLYRSGKIKVEDFVDRGGDPYNLDELRLREADAFKRAGL